MDQSETRLLEPEVRREDAERSTSGGATLTTPLPTTTTAGSAEISAARKPRSCIVCRTRKVKCDKRVPCGNCRRAKIPCDRPVLDRVPRWAKNLEKRPSNAASTTTSTAGRNVDHSALIERLRRLEETVVDLRAQLDTAKSPSGSHQQRPSTSPLALSDMGNTASSHSGSTPVGRIVAADSQKDSHYVSSGFWSKVDDEVAQINRLDLDEHELSDVDSDDLTHDLVPESFLFTRHAHQADPRSLHPLPSQIPFLLEVFTESVYYIWPMVHMASTQSMLREFRDTGNISSANEALAFSIYYCAIASMEAQAVLTNFGSTKADLMSRYRTGLELSLAKAEFIERPTITTMQAWVLFLLLARRHESPRFVWMMVGLAMRIAQFLGLQRDGTHFSSLSPFDVEMRRRLWWTLFNLEIRASEDQGSEPSIILRSDTKAPLNINDTDISPTMTAAPIERRGKTDMSTLRVLVGISETSRKILALSPESQTDLDQLNKLLGDIIRQFEEEYFHDETVRSGNIIDFIAYRVARIIMCKLTLLSFSSVLYESTNERMTSDLRMKLLIAAIELTEYTHVLRTRKDCERFRWLYATHPHYYALVYLALELRRRPWSALSERGFIAMRLNWQLPSPAKTAGQKKVWVPLHQLVRAVRLHRESEISRLRRNLEDAGRLEAEEMQYPLPSSAGLLAEGADHEAYRVRWRQLVGLGRVREPHSLYTPPDTISSGVGDVHRTQGLSNGGGGDFHSFSAQDSEDFSGLDLDAWLQNGGPSQTFNDMLEPSMGIDIDHDFDWNEWAQMAGRIE